VQHLVNDGEVLCEPAAAAAAAAATTADPTFKPSTSRQRPLELDELQVIFNLHLICTLQVQPVGNRMDQGSCISSPFGAARCACGGACNVVGLPGRDVQVKLTNAEEACIHTPDGSRLECQPKQQQQQQQRHKHLKSMTYTDAVGSSSFSKDGAGIERWLLRATQCFCDVHIERLFTQNASAGTGCPVKLNIICAGNAPAPATEIHCAQSCWLLGSS
jgi:hypothetical protein